MDQTLKYISETLMQHGNTVLSPGLLHGKMGLAIFFVRPAGFVIRQDGVSALVIQKRHLQSEL